MKTTTTTTITQTPATVTTPITEDYSNTHTAQEGWRCPQCGAIMAPWVSVCINCRGSALTTPTVITPSVWWQTQMPNTTCEYTTYSTASTAALNQEQGIKNTLTENLKKFQG